eukprot:UN13204
MLPRQSNSYAGQDPLMGSIVTIELLP